MTPPLASSRHYTGIDGLIESVPASLEERKKKDDGRPGEDGEGL